MRFFRSVSGGPSSCARWALAGALAALLAACGGGSSSTPAASAPVVPPAQAVEISFTPSQVFAGQTATLAWSSANATSCAASGAWAGPQPASGSLTVSVTVAGSPTYTLTCNGPDGTASASATLSVAAANVLPVTVDRGPTGESFNMPFVSVTVCVPGTATCRTVDRVVVDTGSNGLRLVASALGSGVALPAVNTAAALPAAECGQFVGGFTWGAVRRADVRLAGKTAAGIPVQVIGDPAPAYASVPFACSGAGADIGTVAALGANGILGVGTSTQDCGTACASTAASGLYYACDSSGCTGTALPLESQLLNPVTAFAVDNNGVALAMPAVPLGGSKSLTGTLIFGIGTQGNNQMGDATVYPTSDRGTFTTVYKGVSYTSSFIDSGSNGIFFDDTSIPVCSGFYCPPSPLTLDAVNVSSSGASGTVTFFVESLQPLNAGAVAIHAGGTIGLPRTFDWGLPFFFGRTVFVGITGASTPKGTGPFWAY
jgi:hypothetical protein